MGLIDLATHLASLKNQLQALNAKVDQAHAIFNQVVGARDQIAQIIGQVENPPQSDVKPEVESLK